jgi:hypothetical protein
LQAKIKKSYLPNNEDGNEIAMIIDRVELPPQWPVIDIPKQIGLLQPFYTTLQMVPDGMIEVSKNNLG